MQVANAQDYQPFPTSNAMWRENFGGIEVNCEDYQYFITGDTIINDLMYHKLQKSGIVYAAGGFGCSWDIFWSINYYAGCFRNDVSAKKVYYMNPYTDTEKVIYDFSLSVGDTIPELDYYPNYPTIESIDSIEIGGKFHKRFKIDNKCWDAYTLYIIEGIGSTYGLLSSTFCPFESASTLLCLSINEETFYSDPWWQGNCTPIYLEIEDYSQDKMMISLYPNPTNGELRIESGKLRVENMELFDIYGRKQNVSVENLSSVESRLDISHLSAGIYFMKIYTEIGEVVKKVLKE
jgi:hypothetical protein